MCPIGIVKTFFIVVLKKSREAEFCQNSAVLVKTLKTQWPVSVISNRKNIKSMCARKKSARAKKSKGPLI
jgi:hypothetical protein